MGGPVLSLPKGMPMLLVAANLRLSPANGMPMLPLPPGRSLSANTKPICPAQPKGRRSPRPGRLSPLGASVRNEANLQGQAGTMEVESATVNPPHLRIVRSARA